MDMTYRVSKNAYIELLADMVRRNDSRPIKLLTTFLLTLGQRLSCPLHAVGPVEERADALYIYCGGTIFDIIPAEAFKNADAMQRFARDLRTAAEQAKMPGEKADAVPTAAADLTWEMDEKQFLDGQFIAFRTLYYCYRFVRRAARAFSPRPRSSSARSTFWRAVRRTRWTKRLRITPSGLRTTTSAKSNCSRMLC